MWLESECAAMLALYFPVLISLALAAPGVSRSCYLYCKESEPIKREIPRECNCADLIDNVMDSNESPTTSLDDTGVYFVPAKLHLFQEQFASQPFFISNPAKLVKKTSISRFNTEFDPPNESLNDPMTSQSEHFEIHERTETISHTSINHEWVKAPLYLDVEIEKSIGNRAAFQKSTEIEDIESTEQALVECLDFQVVHYSRKYGLIKDFNDFWEARNLNKYEHLSNFDIEENMQKYCSEPEAIVQQSLHEIKHGLPKKGLDFRSVHENGNIQKTNAIEINATIPTEKSRNKISESGKYSYVTTSTRLLDNSTDFPATHDSTTEVLKLAKNDSELYTTYDSIENWTFPYLTYPPTLNGEISEVHSKTDKELYDTTNNPTDTWYFANFTPPILSGENVREIYPRNNSFAHTSSYITITTENTLIADKLEKSTTAANHSKEATVKTKLDLNTTAFKDVLLTYIPTELTEVVTTGNAEFSDNLMTLPALTTPSSTEDSLGKESATAETTISTVHTFNDNETSHISATTAYSQVRNAYAERDIKIPKITTKECQNTVESTIHGNEELPNNDFIDFRTPRANDFETTNGTSDNENEIVGKLYFISKTELVPVRFVQKDAGAISLGIDGITICDKLLHKADKKSQLLATLCDYMKTS